MPVCFPLPHRCPCRASAAVRSERLPVRDIFAALDARGIISPTPCGGWIRASPIAGTKPPRGRRLQAVPLDCDEMRALLKASEGRRRGRALPLLMRVSGLAIRDAATVRHAAIRENGCLVLRRAKTDELVTVLMPEPVLAALRKIARPDDRPHYFWTGRPSASHAKRAWKVPTAPASTAHSLSSSSWQAPISKTSRCCWDTAPSPRVTTPQGTAPYVAVSEEVFATPTDWTRFSRNCT